MAIMYAHKAAASEDEAVFDETLKRIAKAKPETKDNNNCAAAAKCQRARYNIFQLSQRLP